jgi:opacity protein-like surface antigen
MSGILPIDMLSGLKTEKRIMKRLLFASFLIILFSSIAVAQDFPKVELYGGYSVQRMGISDDAFDAISSDLEGLLTDAGYTVTVTNSRFLKKGLEGAVTFNINSVFGFVADFRYVYDDVIQIDIQDQDISANIKFTNLAVLGGPRFAFRSNEKVTPFAHVLVGLDRWKVSGEGYVEGQSFSASESIFDNGLGVAFGGGFDVNLGDTVAIRLIQADYYLTRHQEERLDNLELSAGIVFRFGWGY